MLIYSLISAAAGLLVLSASNPRFAAALRNFGRATNQAANQLLIGGALLTLAVIIVAVVL